MGRKYFGTVLLEKVYRGNKSVNLVVNKSEGIKLVKAILSLIESDKNKFDLAIYDYRRTREGKIRMTVTSKL